MGASSGPTGMGDAKAPCCHGHKGEPGVCLCGAAHPQGRGAVGSQRDPQTSLWHVCGQPPPAHPHGQSSSRGTSTEPSSPPTAREWQQPHAPVLMSLEVSPPPFLHTSAVPVPLLRVAAHTCPCPAGALQALQQKPPNRKGAEPAVSVCFRFAFIFRPLELLQRGHGPQLSVQEQSPRAGQFQQPAQEFQGHRPERGCVVGLSQPQSTCVTDGGPAGGVSSHGHSGPHSS